MEELQITEIVSLYKSGTTIHKISSENQIPYRIIARELEKYYVANPEDKTLNPIVEEIAEKHLIDKIDVKEISEEYEITVARVQEYINEYRHFKLLETCGRLTNKRIERATKQREEDAKGAQNEISKRIVQLYEDGYDISEIAGMCEKEEKNIKKVLHKHYGDKLPRQLKNVVARNTVKGLLEKGVSEEEIIERAKKSNVIITNRFIQSVAENRDER